MKEKGEKYMILDFWEGVCVRTCMRDREKKKERERERGRGRGRGRTGGRKWRERE